MLSIECEDKSGIPTDERLENIQQGGGSPVGGEDIGIINLAFAYGRYLLWKNGRVTGLRARGGEIVNIEWRDGKVV